MGNNAGPETPAMRGHRCLTLCLALYKDNCSPYMYLAALVHRGYILIIHDGLVCGCDKRAIKTGERKAMKNIPYILEYSIGRSSGPTLLTRSSGPTLLPARQLLKEKSVKKEGKFHQLRMNFKNPEVALPNERPPQIHLLITLFTNFFQVQCRS